MKLTWLIISFCISCSFCSAQTYNMSSSQTYITCSGSFYDGGGNLGNYQNNQNVEVTFKPVNSGDKISITFNSFATEDNDDVLFVHNGNSVGAPQIGIL